MLSFEKVILLSSPNFNFKFLYTLEIYLHKLKLIYCSLIIVPKIRIYKNLYIFGAFTSLKSLEIFFKSSGKPGKLREFYFEVSVWTLLFEATVPGLQTKCFIGVFLKLSTRKSDLICNHWEKYKHLPYSCKISNKYMPFKLELLPIWVR